MFVVQFIVGRIYPDDLNNLITSETNRFYFSSHILFFHNDLITVALNHCCHYSFVLNCRGHGRSNEIHQWENYQDFLKWGAIFRSLSYKNGGLFLGHYLIIIKWTWVFFSQTPPPPSLIKVLKKFSFHEIKGSWKYLR